MSAFHFIYHGDDIGIKEYLGKLGFSATFIKRVKYGGVRQNGNVIHMRAIVKDGDCIDIEDKDEGNPAILPRKDISLHILYEDDDILAVSKPSGMPTHPSRGNHLPTLAEAVLGHFDGKPFTFRAVNRLDKDTAGIVLVAKNATAAYHLSSAMKKGQFQKEYDAIVSGIPSPSNGTICAPIRRESEGSMRRCVAEDGKVAVTDYEITKIFPDGNAAVHLVLHTGRTHQIRVHMAYIGHPLVGDSLYGNAVDGRSYSLRASKIRFPHPTTNEILEIRDEECDV